MVHLTKFVPFRTGRWLRGLRLGLGGFVACAAVWLLSSVHAADTTHIESQLQHATAKQTKQVQDSIPKAPKIDLTGRVEDKAPVLSWQHGDGEEAKAYFQTLIAAHVTSLQAFANSARHDLTYAHLFEEPHKYRGEVIHVEGRLKRVRVFEAHTFVRSYDIHDIYEGWIFDPEIYGANPICVIFTELPVGLEVKEEVKQRVSFDGYFFKRYRYEAADATQTAHTKVFRDAPLLIGRSVVLKSGSLAVVPDGDTAFSKLLVNCFLSVLAATVVFSAGLAWWYHRGDRQVRSRVAGLHSVGFVEPTPGDEKVENWLGAEEASEVNSENDRIAP